MSCQRVAYLHDDGRVYADAHSCHGCSLRGTEHCDGWRENKQRRPQFRRTASLRPKRQRAES